MNSTRQIPSDHASTDWFLELENGRVERKNIAKYGFRKKKNFSFDENQIKGPRVGEQLFFSSRRRIGFRSENSKKK